MRYSIFTSVVIAATVWTVTTRSTQAQMWEPSPHVDIPQAIELERGAEIPKSDPGQWTRAAFLLRKASRLRPGNDPIALIDLQTAGTIYGNVEKFGAARSTLVELVDRATEFGEVEVAAHALIDATYVEVELENVPSALRFYERAQRLAMSSHLTSEEQQRITMRLEPSTTFVAASDR